MKDVEDTERPFAEEGYALMGAAFEVQRTLGGGLLEEINFGPVGKLEWKRIILSEYLRH
jgi:hypothetical protein